MKETKEKSKALNLAIEKLEKTYGQGTIMKLSDENIVKIPSIPTGSLSLDIALGIGGLPQGRVVEIFGPESSGKTTLSMHCIAEAQKKGGIAAFIDAEHAFDKTYAEKLGIDTENLLISQPDNGEQALEITEHLIRSNAIDIIVIDSVAALVPKGEIEGEMGDSMMGLQARLMSQALRKLTGAIHKSGCVCVFINQLRQKIGVMFGNPETTTGGNALKFYSSVRLDIRRIGQIKDSPDNIMGNRTKVKVVKNKVAPPFKVVEFDIMYGKGISKSGEILDLGVELELIQKSGSWFSYKGEKLGQGRDSVKLILEDNPELMKELDGIELVLPAHGHPFSNLASRSESIIRHHKERLQTIREAGAELGEAPVEKFMKRLFKERSWGDMAASETYAHLEHLRILGEASQSESNGIKNYLII